jgi:hypothetical protein
MNNIILSKIKLIFLFLPSLLLIFFSCSKEVKPTTTHRIVDKFPSGKKVTILPVDVRFHVKGKISKKKYKKIMKSIYSAGLLLGEFLPYYLEAKNYKIVNRITWSGNSILDSTKITPILSDKQLARIIYSSANFASIDEDSSLNNQISPEMFKKLSKSSDFTLYTASWSKFSIRKKTKIKVKNFLKAGLLVISLVLITISLMAVFDKLGKRKNGGLLKVFGKTIFPKFASAVLKNVVKIGFQVAIESAKVATHVAVATVMDGPKITDIEDEKISVVSSKIPNGINNNKYLGISNNISFLEPLTTEAGYYLVFLLINNKTGYINYEGKIWIPPKSKKRELRSVLEKLFLTFPSSK